MLNILQIMQNRNQIMAQFDGQALQAQMQQAMADSSKDEVKVKLESLGEQYALTLLAQEKSVALQTLERMKNEMPNMYNLVMQKIKDVKVKMPQIPGTPIPKQPDPQTGVVPEIGDGGMIRGQASPLPEKNPPRRAVGGN
jgi:hypothetical protein